MSRQAMKEESERFARVSGDYETGRQMGLHECFEAVIDGQRVRKGERDQHRGTPFGDGRAHGWNAAAKIYED